MSEDMSQHEVQSHAKRRKTEIRGRTIGIQLLSGAKIIGTLEESRPNILVIRDWRDKVLKEVHRALVQRFMFVIDGGKVDG